MAVILSSQLGNLVKTFGPKKIYRSVLESSNVIGSGALQQIKANGAEHRVAVSTGGEQSASWISDNELLPEGNSNLHSMGTILPAGLIAQLSIGRLAADMEVSEGEATSLFMSEMDRVANSLARHLGRGLYGTGQAPAANTTWSGTASGSESNVTFTDVSLFKPGAAYEFDDASESKTFVVRCSNVTYGAVSSSSANVAGTVTFVNDIVNPTDGAVVALSNTTISTSDTFRQRGTSPLSASFGAASSSTSQAMVSFDDIAGSGTLHGIAGTVAGWTGNSLALSAAYSQEAMLAFMSRITARSGQAPTHVIMHPSLSPVHAAAGISGATAFGLGTGLAGAGARRDVSANFDKYGLDVANIADRARSGLALGGKEILLDVNCPVGRVYFHNKELVKLVEFLPLGPVKQSGDAKLVSSTKLAYNVQFQGAFNLACTLRSGIGVVTGITDL